MRYGKQQIITHPIHPETRAIQVDWGSTPGVRYKIIKCHDFTYMFEDKDGELVYDISSDIPYKDTVEELTLEQVCKELGRDIKIVKN